MPKKSEPASSESIDEGRRAMLDKAVGDIVKRYGMVPSCGWAMHTG